jgi:integrase
VARRGNGEGSIYRRQDGRWAASLTLRTGRRRIVYGTTRQEAAARLAGLVRERDLQLPAPTGRLTVAKFLSQWLEGVVKPSVRPSTYGSYRDNVRLHIAPELGRIRVAELSPQDVLAFLSRMTASGLSTRSVRYLHAILRSALSRAVEWGEAGRNVARVVSPPRAQQEERLPLSQEQARQLLQAVRGDRLEALFTVALGLGLRQGEALGLRWADVDLVNARLWIRHSLQRVDGQFQLAEPTTPRSRRSLDMPQVVLTAMTAHRARQLEERLAAGAEWQDRDLVFCGYFGQFLHGRWVTKHFQEVLQRAGLPRQRFHDLRHGCASILAAQGVPAQVVMEILGHSQISTTMDIYAHVFPDVRREAARLVDAALSVRSSGNGQADN